jgi:hypothetical protein
MVVIVRVHYDTNGVHYDTNGVHYDTNGVHYDTNQLTSALVQNYINHAPQALLGPLLH